MKKKLLSTAMVLALSAGAASAAVQYTVTVHDASGDGSGALANTSNVYASNYGANLPAGATSMTASVVTPPPGSVDSVYRSPWDGNALEDDNSYFAVGPNDSDTLPNPGVLSFGSNQSSLDILWGSIDDYNELTLSGGSAGAGITITGADLAGDIGSPPCATDPNFACTAKLTFFLFDDDDNSALTFDTAEFFSRGAQAFEFALVPLPAAGWLLLGGLGGLGALARKRKNKA